ncbi:MAG: hypothetical protein QM500_19525 [Methylococcales bacterium]
MAKNYGISFCKTGIKHLEKIENDMFEKTGEGFYYFSEENLALKKYTSLLKKFQQEKDMDLTPSYDPNIHGSLSE